MLVLSLATVALGAGLVACSAGIRRVSLSDLRALVAGVPVPQSVHASGPIKQSVEDGPGFTTTKFHEAWRVYRTSVTCNELESDWTSALRGAGRRYAVVHHTPSNFGYYQEVITLPDRGVHVAITLGDGLTHCHTPAVEAYTDPS